MYTIFEHKISLQSYFVSMLNEYGSNCKRIVISAEHWTYGQVVCGVFLPIRCAAWLSLNFLNSHKRTFKIVRCDSFCFMIAKFICGCYYGAKFYSCVLIYRWPSVLPRRTGKKNEKRKTSLNNIFSMEKELVVTSAHRVRTHGHRRVDLT